LIVILATSTFGYEYVSSDYRKRAARCLDVSLGGSIKGVVIRMVRTENTAYDACVRYLL